MRKFDLDNIEKNITESSKISREAFRKELKEHRLQQKDLSNILHINKVRISNAISGHNTDMARKDRKKIFDFLQKDKLGGKYEC